MRSEFSSLLSHLHRSFDSPPRGATEAGVVSVLYPFSYYMYTCILRCVVDLHYVCICMLYVYICDHVHSNVSTALMVSKHICALVRERMIQDVCAWIFGGGCHGEIISDPFCVCVCSDLLPPLCKWWCGWFIVTWIRSIDLGFYID